MVSFIHSVCARLPKQHINNAFRGDIFFFDSLLCLGFDRPCMVEELNSTQSQTVGARTSRQFVRKNNNAIDVWTYCQQNVI